MAVRGRYNASFERGVFHVEVRGVHFFVAHLNAHDSSARARETAVLAELVRNSSRGGSRVVVMGDLNTLSPLDARAHANLTLDGLPFVEALSTRWCYKALRRKFLTTTTAAGGGGRGSGGRPKTIVDYRPMQNILDAGMVDLSRDRRPTEPTAIPCDQAGACPCPHLRLDYMLYHDGGAAGVARGHAELSAAAEVVIDDETALLSDHYPIEGHFELPPGL